MLLLIVDWSHGFRELGKVLLADISVNDDLRMREGWRTDCSIVTIHVSIDHDIVIIIHHARDVRGGHHISRFYSIHGVVIAVITEADFASLSVSDHLSSAAQLGPADNTDVQILLVALTDANKIFLQTEM